MRMTRLSIMMFLQYAVWGVWSPVIARYLQAPYMADGSGGLGFTPGQTGWILGLGGAVGALVAPFIGQIADRYLRAEWCLAALIVAGGAVKWITALQSEYLAWLWLSIVYSMLFMPTLALTNSIAFAHLKDPDTQFPRVRVWGTIGWIAVAWLFPAIWLQTDLQLQWKPPFLVGTEVPDVTSRLADSLIAAGMISGAYALFCVLFLPRTPPRRDAVEPLAIAKSLRLLARPSFALLMFTALVIAGIHLIYFIQTGPFLVEQGLREADILPAMSIGQFAEIAVMAFLGLLLKRLGFRVVLTLGALAYLGRFALFGSTDLPLQIIVASQALHGFSYACYFAAAYIYVERLADEDVRHSAQTLFAITILGIGPIIGGWFNGVLAEWSTTDVGVLDYSRFWYTLAGIGATVALILAVGFRDQTSGRVPPPPAPPPETG